MSRSQGDRAKVLSVRSLLGQSRLLIGKRSRFTATEAQATFIGTLERVLESLLVGYQCFQGVGHGDDLVRKRSRLGTAQSLTPFTGAAKCVAKCDPVSRDATARLCHLRPGFGANL